MALREPHVVLTNRLMTFIKTATNTDFLTGGDKKELLEYVKNFDLTENIKHIPYRLVNATYIACKKTDLTIYLHEMLDGSDLHLTEPTLVARSPELEARIEILKAQQANREYRYMTRNISKQLARADPTIGQEIKMMNTQMIAVFNLFVTVGGAFTFGYFATVYMIGYSNVPVQIIVGTILGTIVFFADLYFLVKHTALEDSSR